MKLKHGIQFKSDVKGFESQLLINSGASAATKETGVFYKPGSFIPLNDWKSLDAVAKSTLLSNRHLSYNKIIKIGEITEDLKIMFQKMNLCDVTAPDEVYPTVRKHEETVKLLTSELDKFFAKFSTHKQYKFHRITRAMPNRETITCHYVNEKFIYIGLHVDRSRIYKPHTAYKSGNRISINIGTESRSLAIVNLSLIQAYNMIREKASSEVAITSGNIANLFFTYFPEYPVIKLKIKPYQYYIAPTDNFFHDATTIGMQSVDITLVYTGMFDKI